MALSFTPNATAPFNPAEAPKKPHLYIGNLSPRVTDQMLSEIFAVAGPVVSAKIIQDRNLQHGGYNYGFVEYSDMRSAEQALATLNGRKIFDAEVRVNWAYQGQASREDTQHHFHVFVGDLSPEVNDEMLGTAFRSFTSLSEARVMWDMNSGKSRGYGFLSFRWVDSHSSTNSRDKNDAEAAITSMNGEWLGSRAIRVNWANQKTQTGGSRAMGPSTPPPGPMTFEQVAAQTPEYNTTVYVGNLIPYTTQADLVPLFQNYGYIVEIRIQADRGFAFVKLDSHANAALAITNLQNNLVHGRPVKCSWGKDRQADTPGYYGYYGFGGGGEGGVAGVAGAAGAGVAGAAAAAAAGVASAPLPNPNSHPPSEYEAYQGWGGYYQQRTTPSPGVNV